MGFKIGIETPMAPLMARGQSIKGERTFVADLPVSGGVGGSVAGTATADGHRIPARGEPDPAGRAGAANGCDWG